MLHELQSLTQKRRLKSILSSGRGSPTRNQPGRNLFSDLLCVELVLHYTKLHISFDFPCVSFFSVSLDVGLNVLNDRYFCNAFLSEYFAFVREKDTDISFAQDAIDEFKVL